MVRDGRAYATLDLIEQSTKILREQSARIQLTAGDRADYPASLAPPGTAEAELAQLFEKLANFEKEAGKRAVDIPALTKEFGAWQASWKGIDASFHSDFSAPGAALSADPTWQGVAQFREHLTSIRDSYKNDLLPENANRMVLPGDCGEAAQVIAPGAARENHGLSAPKVGERLKVDFSPAKQELGWDYHYAAAVLADGEDTVTLETAAEPNLPKLTKGNWDFKMYGTGKQSFWHEAWKEYAESMTKRGDPVSAEILEQQQRLASGAGRAAASGSGTEATTPEAEADLALARSERLADELAIEGHHAGTAAQAFMHDAAQEATNATEAALGTAASATRAHIDPPEAELLEDRGHARQVPVRVRERGAGLREARAGARAPKQHHRQQDSHRNPERDPGDIAARDPGRGSLVDLGAGHRLPDPAGRGPHRGRRRRGDQRAHRSGRERQRGYDGRERRRRRRRHRQDRQPAPPGQRRPSTAHRGDQPAHVRPHTSARSFCGSIAIPMQSRRALALASLLLSLISAATGCKKKDGDPAAAVGAVDDPWSGPIDPWAGPPPGAVAIAAKDGERLAKLDVAAAPAAPEIPAAEPTADGADPAIPAPPGGGMSGMKIDLGKIAAPEPEKLELRGFGSIQPTGFSVTYNPSPNAAHEEYRKLLEGNRVFEKFAERLNKTIRIPNQVEIQLVDCNTINAFYDPNGKRIIVCYELVDYFLRVFKPVAKNNDELGSAVFGAVAFSFFHEVGHGLIHQLELPAVGREEDSADQIATLTLLGTGDEGVGMALSGAYWFQLQQKGGNETPFWDEHAFDGQRFYNIVCLIYGSDPAKYGNFVASGTLPAARAKRCPEEYAKIGKAWNTLLASHFTSSGAENAGAQVAVAEPRPQPLPRSTAPPEPTAVANPEPTATAPAAPEPTAVQSQHAITCEQVAEKASELIGAELEQRVRAMSQAEKLEAQHKIETELPAALETILAQCRSADWNDASRLCVINATTLTEASACE